MHLIPLIQINYCFTRFVNHSWSVKKIQKPIQKKYVLCGEQLFLCILKNMFWQRHIYSFLWNKELELQSRQKEIKRVKNFSSWLALMNKINKFVQITQFYTWTTYKISSKFPLFRRIDLSNYLSLKSSQKRKKNVLLTIVQLLNSKLSVFIFVLIAFSVFHPFASSTSFDLIWLRWWFPPMTTYCWWILIPR